MEKIYRVQEWKHDDLARHLLALRGVEDDESVARFLAPDFERDSHDPFLLPDMGKAVDRIIDAIKKGEHICVWSDYDCDGIPGGVMLVEFLRSINAHVTHYIPHRHDEGYGLNTEGVDEIARDGVTLMITVDLGITDIDAIDHARERGIDVIVTDHHLPGDVLPSAIAVVDAHRKDSQYPFKDLCGAGVAWKLVQAILSCDRFGLKEGQEKWLLDLVGLATLSDMVPLVGENRMLAAYGLIVMRKNRRPGLRALFSIMNMRAATLTEDDVVFMVTPRINAASRMDSPDIAAQLLAASDDEEARAWAERLQHLNNERKGLVASIVKDARKRLRERDHDDDKKLVVIGDPSWRPGVLGLVANALVESEGTPAFVWGRHGDADSLKGSCRSDGSVNVVDLMRAAQDVFLDVGGHAMSGGFSLAVERAHELAPALLAAHSSLQSDATSECFIDVDRELSVASVRSALRTVESLAPFGVAHPKPLFIFRQVRVSSVRSFGKQSDHLEIAFTQGKDMIVGVSFFATPESFARKPEVEMEVDVVGNVEKDFRGAPRLRIVDIL
ncbi:MAG TPA: single-stranded-DNA-specific exonuclease RecJ [Candidatus Paceibacterota bacterium]